MDTVSIAQSFLRNGLWQAADWQARIVNDETGEILITAVCGDDEEMIGVRLTTESVRQLRELTAFASANMRRDAEQSAPDGSRVLRYDVAHECNDVRLAELEKIIANLARRVKSLRDQVGLLQAEHVSPADVQEYTVPAIVRQGTRRDAVLLVDGESTR